MTSRQRRLILGLAAALLVFLLCACSVDMDRSGWGWDGSKGNEPNDKRFHDMADETSLLLTPETPLASAAPTIF